MDSAAELVAFLSAGPEAYFVGGCVRDRVLGRPSVDLDVAVPDAVERARAYADLTRSPFVLLDAERGTARVVGRRGGLEIDFAELAGALT